MERVSLNYDEASTFSKWLMLWPAKLMKHFRGVHITAGKLPEVPQSLEYEEQLQALFRNWAEEQKQPNPQFVKVLIRTMPKELGKILALTMVPPLGALSQIVAMGFLIRWLRDDDAELYLGLIYLMLFAILGFISFLFSNRGLMILVFVISKAKTFVAFIVAEKLLRVSYSTISSGHTSAKITNLVGTDIEMMEILTTAYTLWSLPLLIIAATGVLWMYLGYAGLVAMGLILLQLCILAVTGKLMMGMRLSIAAITDRRIKLITNLIEGIKLVKLYAWEQPFLAKIFGERALEIQQFLKLAYSTCVLVVMYFGLFGTTSLTALKVHIDIYGELSIESAFAGISVISLSILYIIVGSTLGLRSLFVFLATCQRITEVLLLPETVDDPAQVNQQHCGLSIKEAAFTWSDKNLENENPIRDTYRDEEELVRFSDEFLLTNVNINIEPGELVIVTGPVGCGKTTLLVGILEEIYLVTGSLEVTSSLAYVPESSWIFPGTVRDNIVMGRDFNSDLYAHALQVSDLWTDIDTMEEKDATVIGDTSLSGGQKARVALARAVYADADLLLLDDPLSAVDAAVGARMFEHLRSLVEQGKSIILATHQIHTLPYADQVVLLDEGRQVYCGDYEGMKDQYAYLVGEGEARQSYAHNLQTADFTPEEVRALKEDVPQQLTPVSIYAHYLGYAYKKAITFLPIVLILLGSQALFPGMYYWVSVWSSADDQTNQKYPFVFGIIVLGCYLLGAFRFVLTYYSLIQANKNLHNASLEGLVRTKARFFDENSVGLLLNRFTKDVAVTDENLLNYFVEVVNSTVFVAGLIILVFICSPGALVGLLIYVILLAMMVKMLMPIAKGFRMTEIISRGPLLSTVNSIINGVLTIRCLDVEQYFVEAMKEAATTNLKAILSYVSALRFLQFVSEMGSLAILVTNAISIIALKGTISPEIAATALALTVSVSGLCSFWAKDAVETDSYMLSPHRLYQFTQLTPEPTNDEPFTLTDGSIHIKNVYAKYAPELPFALRGLSLKIPARAKVGIVGRTGAGKSSVLQVLFRLISPSSGTIYIDGQDYLQVGLTALRSSMSVIPQSPLIFRGTVIENIDPLGFYEEETIIEVLEKVRLLAFFNQQPEKLNSILSPDHVSLSAGQKQLVCLARAIIKQSKIVVMDEATANVDNQTDKLMQKMIRKSFRRSTLVIIAHRLRTIIDSEFVAVLDAGECVEFGAPQELVRRRKSMFSQFIDLTGPEEARYLRKKIKLLS